MSALSLSRLDQLEAESIHVIREVVAEFERPVLMYSIGKDSSVLLHLALKAVAPGRLPFPLLHIDTGWKFREMITFRQATCERHGLSLLVHTNRSDEARALDPFVAGSKRWTDVMKTDALKQAIAAGGFDAAIGGARRDEERSRAKERIYSVRDRFHQWEPRSQRPELWNLYNARLGPGESMRVFPLSNWTELDVWHYVWRERIDVVPLYFAAPRPVVERAGALFVVDDDRMRLEPGETPQLRSVRFRTLGCYPFTAAIESTARTLEEIIAEMLAARTSERQGRLIDHDESGSMEQKKREGYF